MILDIKVLSNNDFNMLPDKVMGVSPTLAPIYLINCSKIKYRVVCVLFIGKNVTLVGKKLSLRTCLSYIKNGLSQHKNIIWKQKFIRLYNFLANTEAN